MNIKKFMVVSFWDLFIQNELEIVIPPFPKVTIFFSHQKLTVKIKMWLMRPLILVMLFVKDRIIL